MTEYQVKKSKAFDRDIERIAAYLSKASYYDATIKDIFEMLYKDIARLRTSPMIGAKLTNKTTIANDYRYLVSGQYLIFYKVIEREKLVRVYHVYHGKENYLTKLKLL